MRALVLLTLLASNVAIADGTSRTLAGRLRFAAPAHPALLQSLNADLLSHDSATLTLDRWCAAHQLATPATIVAERIRNVYKPPTAEQREQLKVSATSRFAIGGCTSNAASACFPRQTTGMSRHG